MDKYNTVLANDSYIFQKTTNKTPKKQKNKNKKRQGFWDFCDNSTFQSVPITTKVVSSNPVHGEVYSIQHYVIKFLSDLRQIGGFLCWKWR